MLKMNGGGDRNVKGKSCDGKSLLKKVRDIRGT